MRAALEVETLSALTAASSSNDLKSERPVNADADMVNIDCGSEDPPDVHKRSIVEELTRTSLPFGLVPSEMAPNFDVRELEDSG